MGKHKRTRQQQLHEIQERRTRYQAKMPEVKFSLIHFLTEHIFEICFGLFFIGAFIFIYSIKYRPFDGQKIASLSSSISPDQIKSLHKAYPQGFQVFAITNNDILPLNVNTLPPELTIDWEASSVGILNQDVARFQIGPVKYESKLLASALPVKLPLRQGKTSSSVVLNGIELTIELLGQYNNSDVFCVLGFKKR